MQCRAWLSILLDFWETSALWSLSSHCILFWCCSNQDISFYLNHYRPNWSIYLHMSKCTVIYHPVLLTEGTIVLRGPKDTSIDLGHLWRANPVERVSSWYVDVTQAIFLLRDIDPNDHAARYPAIILSYDSIHVMYCSNKSQAFPYPFQLLIVE